MKKLDKSQEAKSYDLVKTITKAWEKTENAFQHPMMAQALQKEATFKEQKVLKIIEDAEMEENDGAVDFRAQ